MAFIGERARDLRLERNFSQKQISELLNVAQNTYSQWETNKKDPSTAMLKALCDILECSADYLLGRTDI